MRNITFVEKTEQIIITAERAYIKGKQSGAEIAGVNWHGWQGNKRYSHTTPRFSRPPNALYKKIMHDDLNFGNYTTKPVPEKK